MFKTVHNAVTCSCGDKWDTRTESEPVGVNDPTKHYGHTMTIVWGD